MGVCPEDLLTRHAGLEEPSPYLIRGHPEAFEKAGSGFRRDDGLFRKALAQAGALSGRGALNLNGMKPFGAWQ